MRIKIISIFALFAFNANSQNTSTPIVDSNLVFEDKKQMVVIEAEHFYKQTQTEKRAWYLSSPEHKPCVWPDHDTASYLDAGGYAYMEALPDLFHSEEDPIIPGDNLGSNGNLAVMHYKVFFNNPGVYYIWTRLRSNDEEDNTIGAGIDDTWPKSAQILQSPVNKKEWVWKSDNRISRNPWKIGRAYIDVPSTGIHDIQFYMREDGEEFDRFILTSDSLYTISEGIGPEVTVKSGHLPVAFQNPKEQNAEGCQLINPDGSVYGANVLYFDTLETVVFEAENYYRQTKAESRMWHLVTSNYQSGIGPDNDPAHLENASENAYLELLPDGRQKDEDGINSKNSICGEGGQKAILSYFVKFDTVGKYFVWVRAFAVDGDDNTLHAGVDNSWPESGKKITFGGQSWKWTNKQRTTNERIYITIDSPGIHEVQFSMREDGCEIDRILLTKNENLIPNDSVAIPAKKHKGEIEKWYNERETRLNANFIFIPNNDTIIIEAESVPTHGGWNYKADTCGHLGLGYIEWGTEGQGIKPGEGILTYKFRIDSPGKYQVLLRSKMLDHTNRMDTPDPDGNDVWLKISGGENIEGQAVLNSVFNKVAILGHPKGFNWNTNLDKGKPHPIAPLCQYFEEGEYVLELSGRSFGHAIDRIAIVKYLHHPVTDFQIPEIDNLNRNNEIRVP